MADLVCNQRWTPGIWVDLAATKAARPTGQPARLGGEPYRTEQLEDIRGSRGTNSSRTRHEKNDSTATMKEAHVVVVARAEGHRGVTGMQTRQEAAETWPSMRDRLEVGRHVAAAAPSRSSGLHAVEARHREMEGWMGATEGSSPTTE